MPLIPDFLQTLKEHQGGEFSAIFIAKNPMNFKLSIASTIILFAAVALTGASEMYIVTLNKTLEADRQEFNECLAAYQAAPQSSGLAGRALERTKNCLSEKQGNIIAQNNVIQGLRLFEFLLSYLVLMGICPQIALQNFRLKSKFTLTGSNVTDELAQVSFKVIYTRPQDESEMLRCGNKEKAMVCRKEIFSLSDLDRIIFTPPDSLIIKFISNDEMQCVFEKEPKQLAIIYNQRLFTAPCIMHPVSKDLRLVVTQLPENIVSSLAQYLNAAIDSSKNDTRLDTMSEELMSYFIKPQQSRYL